uniref:Uncharacterized protein n=1 Tax=Arundo donax TaxID=35708 RepID=A0A0A9HCF9_ARUDO
MHWSLSSTPSCPVIYVGRSACGMVIVLHDDQEK